MNLPFLIAKRYFFSTKKKAFINIISILSMIVVAFASMALFTALSVFNGLEDLIRKLYNTFDPEIKVTATHGKTFMADSSFMEKVADVEGVEIITEVIEDNALIGLREEKKVVTLKGVSENFIKQSRMDTMIVAGDFKLHKGGQPFAIVGRGIYHEMNVSLNNKFFPLQVSYINEDALGGGTNFNLLLTQSIPVGAVFAIEKTYDDKYVFVPLEFAENLLKFDGRRTALEISTTEDEDVNDVRDRLRELLGDEFTVLNSDEQHASLLKAIKVEKFFLFFLFTCILFIGCLNIFFTLNMLTIDKKKDIAVLISFGATKRLIRKIFIAEGFIISMIGASFGLCIGVILVLVQDQFGLVSMGMETAVVQAYPVKIQISDFFTTAVTIIVIAFLISIGPALRAARNDVKENI